MATVEGVADVHDLHVRTVPSGLVALTAHVEVTGQRPWHEVLLGLCSVVRERYRIAHVTLQPEEPQHLPEVFRGCSLDTPEGRSACRLPAVPSARARAGHRH